MTSRRIFLKSGAMTMLSLGFAPSFLARTAAAAGGRVWRLSVRNLAPNVEVRLEPPASDALGTTDATALTEAFAALGRLASRDAPRGGEPDADPGPGR